MINPFNFALTMTRQVGAAPVMEEKKKTQVTEEKKKQRQLGSANDGREEEAETPGWHQ